MKNGGKGGQGSINRKSEKGRGRTAGSEKVAWRFISLEKKTTLV